MSNFYVDIIAPLNMSLGLVLVLTGQFLSELGLSLTGIGIIMVVGFTMISYQLKDMSNK